MATLYSDIGTLQNNVDPSALTDPLRTANFLRLYDPTYTMTGAEAAADVVNLVEIPPQCVVVPNLSWVFRRGGIATTCTMSVGDDGGGSNFQAVAGSATRYAAAQDFHAAGSTSFGTAGAAASTPFVTTAVTWITATFTTLATPTAAGVLQFYVTVKVPT